MAGRSLILPECANPLANYPHARCLGDMVYLSGISARQPSGDVRGVTKEPDGQVTKDIKEQTRGVLENMRDILRAAGGDLEDLVDVTVFLTDMSLYQDFNSVYNEYFPSAETGPSRTTVGVQSLPGPHLVIEIKGIAHLGK